jgi:excinuclease UvrABC ATPase subunit
MDVIANADAIIDIWPEWGINGGSLLYAGMRDGILDVESSYTWQFLRKYFISKSQGGVS